jgi:hypothetical protein
MVARLPISLAVIDFCPWKSDAGGIWSSAMGMPSRQSVPLGRSVFRKVIQSSLTCTVERIRWKRPACFWSSRGSVDGTKSWAPMASASSRLLAEDENAVTSQPKARAMSSAMCPRPPIPITPTEVAALTPNRRRGE